MYVKTSYKKYEGCWLEVCEYQMDGSTAVKIWSPEDGPVATITTCLADPFIEEGESYVDTNNCPWAMKFIERYGLGEMTGETGRSGYCTYPKVRWNREKLESIRRRHDGESFLRHQ